MPFNEQKDIDSIAGKICSQKDFLQAEIDVISLGFTVEDLGGQPIHEKDTTSSQLLPNVTNTGICNPPGESVPSAKNFKTETYQNLDHSYSHRGRYDADDGRADGYPLARVEESKRETERKKSILKTEEERLLSETLGRPLSRRNGELVRRAFVLGAVKAYGRGKRVEDKRKAATAGIGSGSLDAAKSTSVGRRRKRKPCDGEADGGCPRDIVWDFRSDERSKLEENPLMVPLLGMEEDW